jgi:hypothetical protein
VEDQIFNPTFKKWHCQAKEAVLERDLQVAKGAEERGRPIRSVAHCLFSSLTPLSALFVAVARYISSGVSQSHFLNDQSFTGLKTWEGNLTSQVH